MPRDNSKAARERRRERAKERQVEGYVTKDWRWGGPTMIPHNPVLNMSRHIMQVVIPTVEEATDAFTKMHKVFNQFTDIDKNHTDIVQDITKG